MLTLMDYNKIKKNKFGEFPAFPDLILFHNLKIYPREINYDYKKHRYYIYIYLDPFTSYIEKNKLAYIEKPDIFFGFEPFYVGKGTTGHGYRLNQHVSSYLSGKEKNQYKIAKFKEIEEKMKSNKFPSKPSNWKEYKDHYIITYAAFNNEAELMETEKVLINKIGVKKFNDGPLVNKITQYDQKAIRRYEDDYYN
jgi:putative cell wall-binding protein